MIKTIAKVGYASLKEDAEGNITYDPIIWFKSKEAGGRELSAEPNGEATPIWADGQRVFIAEENQGYDIKLTLIDLIDEIDENWLGNTVKDGSTLEINSSEEKPRFALIVANETLKSSTKYAIDTYYDCMISARPSRKQPKVHLTLCSLNILFLRYPDLTISMCALLRKLTAYRKRL